MALLKVVNPDTGKYRMPQSWFDKEPHTHLALGDATLTNNAYEVIYCRSCTKSINCKLLKIMNVMIPIKSLFASLFNFHPKTSLQYLENIAITERLDEFLEIENSSPEVVEYLTLHGSRTVSNDFPELNVFLVLRKGMGFARAVPMPYIRAYNSKHRIPQLVVEYSQEDAPATLEGYAKAVDLPCDAEGGSLRDHRSEVYVHDLGMLDTDYAATLAGSPQLL